MRDLAILVLAIHLVWIFFVVIGALWTRGRTFWSATHIVALLWGIAVEAGPWPCPLTLLEDYFETRAGISPAHGDFLLRSLDSTVYPNLPGWLVTTLGVAVCVMNLGVYAWRLKAFWRRRRSQSNR